MLQNLRQKNLLFERHHCERMTPDGLAEQTTATKREGVGVEKFAKAGGLAEWKTTIVLTQLRSILFEEFQISGFSLPP